MQNTSVYSGAEHMCMCIVDEHSTLTIFHVTHPHPQQHSNVLEIQFMNTWVCENSVQNVCCMSSQSIDSPYPK